MAISPPSRPGGDEESPTPDEVREFLAHASAVRESREARDYGRRGGVTTGKRARRADRRRARSRFKPQGPAGCLAAHVRQQPVRASAVANLINAEEPPLGEIDERGAGVAENDLAEPNDSQLSGPQPFR